MTKLAEPSTPSGSVENSTTKATDHALQKYDNFTRYGHGRAAAVAMSELGQTEKNSVRANVFRFAIELGHYSMRSVVRICATCESPRAAAMTP